MSNVYDIKVEQGSGTNFKEGIMVFTTSDGDSNVTMSSANVYEGTSNLFYTDDRVQDSPAVDNLQTQIDNLEAGTSGHIAESTGVITGGVLGTGGLTSQYSITDGTAQVVDITGNTIHVSWTGKTNITPTNIGTQLRSYISIDSSGNIVEQAVPYTLLQSRSLIVLGILVHSDLANITIFNNRQVIAYNALSTTHDLAESIGIFNIEGNIFGPNGANLSLDKSVGKAFRYGSNYEIDPNDPHAKILPLLTATSFNYIYNDNSIEQPAVTVIDPANLDDGAGGLTALSNNTKWSVQRIYSFTSNVVVLQRGVEEFGTKSEAILGINSEDYFTAPSIIPNALLRGWLVVIKTATDLTDIDEAEFIQAPKFGEGGGASGGSATAVDLQTAYNNSITPEIITDATRGALTVQSGQALDTENVIEVKNIAGTTNYGITGNGNVTGNSFNGVALTTGGSTNSYLTEQGNYVTIPDYTTAGLVTQVEFNSATTGININLNDLQTQINVINATSGATTTLQTAYNNSTTPEIITDATRGAFTVQNGQALDTEDIWEGKNIAGTTTSVIRGDGSASFTGEVNVSGNIIVSGTVDGRNVSADGATLDSIVSISDGDKGDITVSDSGSNWSIDNDVVSNAKLANMATQTFKGRNTAGTGDPEDLTATQARTILNVENGADVTDTANVDSAGATMNADTDVSANAYVIDEDTMVSNDNTKVPTQQSVKAYVDSVIAGASPKESVHVATTTYLDAISGNTWTKSGSGVGKTLTDGAVGILTVDGHPLILGERVMIKDEDGSSVNLTNVDNGIYEVTTEGTVGVATVLTRTTDFDGDPLGEVKQGSYAFVLNGTANDKTGWMISSTGNVVVDTDPIIFIQFQGLPSNHAITHTDGTDDIQDATTSQKGLMTIAYATKLENIVGITDGDKGDITVSDSGSNWSLDAGVVDSTELANFAVTTGKIAQNNVTLDRMATQTPGSLISYDGDNDPQLIPIGTSGYVLTSNGVGTIPTFQPIGDLGGVTNLSIVNRNTSTLDVASDTGTDATIPSVTTSLSGLMTGADKTKLDGIANGAQPKPTLSKTFTLEAPTATDDITIFRTDVAITVQEVIAVSTGTTPSTTYVLRHSTDRSLAGSLLTTSGATTSTTTGDIATLSGGGSVLADSWIWLETTLASGTDVFLSIDIRYTED